jgi:galactokinase
MEKKNAAKTLFVETFGEHPNLFSFAPGRIEFIGNHTDYNGGNVIGTAIKEGVTMAFKRRDDYEINIISENKSLVKSELEGIHKLENEDSWANYPLGVTEIFVNSGYKIDYGFDLAIVTDLPIGAGLSSSAAVELGLAVLLNDASSLNLEKHELAQLCRRAENEFVGVPCGILDQGVSAFGKSGNLVKIDCMKESFDLMPFTTNFGGINFWIINTNMKHSLVDSLYAERFEECQLALKVFQNKFPRIINLSQVDYGMLEICKSRLGDTLYRRALHVIGENERVSKLSKAINDYDCEAIGALMYQSHKSSRLNFENSTEELDFLVNSIKKYDSVYGARLTGGGFGGAIVVLAKNTLSSELENEIRLAYKREFNIELSTLCTRSEDGARILN